MAYRPYVLTGLAVLAVYAPVVLRFATYGATLSEPAGWYRDQVLSDAHLREWIRGAEREIAVAGRPVAHP